MSAVYHPTRMRAFQRVATGAVLLALVGMASGCSVRRFATNQVADVLAASGTTYSSDDDPELVAQALPFSLKLMESVLAEAPEHRALLAATSAAFTQYAFAFVQQEGDRLSLDDSERAWAAWYRARRLYLRARDYGLRGLDAAMPGFSARLRADRAAAVGEAGPEEVDLLFWTAVSWAAAVSLAKDDPSLVADLPLVSALIDRALAVAPDWDRGAIHSFLIAFEMARPDVEGDRLANAKRHFDRAVELSGGRAVGPHVSWAEAVCMAGQDRDCFDAALAAAAKIDPDADPSTRLVNVVMKRRAEWLRANADRWILPPLADEDPPAGGTP